MHALTPCSRPRLVVRLTVTRLLLFFLTLLLAKSGLAGTFAAFGPVTYVRSTGDPVTVTNAFSVRNPATQYTLHIVNGGLTDTPYELVSSSLIALNGVQVVGPDSFNKNVTVIDVPVTLQASNTISVQVRSKPGGALSIAVIGVDNDPPAVSASAAPAANVNGWNNSDVTVSFTCSDATSGIATCPAAQTVSPEGEGQIISGTATDNTANTASASVTVNLDKTPPSLTVTMPGGTVSTSPLTVSGSASDALSGLDTVTCNGLLGTLSGTNFTCEVSLLQGANSIVITATDRAGNSATQTLGVTLGQELSPPPNSIEITPGKLAIVVDEPRELALVDDFGRPVTGASWSVSDPSVVEIASTSPLVVTGKAPGTATISATFENFAADAVVTVFAAPTLPPGTVRWSVQPAPASSTVQILQAQPAENAPDIYSIEEEATGNLIIRALASDGRQIWRRPVELSGGAGMSAATSPSATTPYTSRFFVQALADAFGGLLILTEDDFGIHSEITRLDGATGQETWRYTSTGMLYNDWALHPDGTIFVGEIASPSFFLNEDFFNLATRDIQVLAINGTTGTVKSRVPIPQSFNAVESDCPFQDSSVFPFFSELGAPMVAPNGSMYVETATRTFRNQIFEPACAEQHVIQDTSLLLLELRPDGSSAWRTLKQDHFEGPRPERPPQPDYNVGEVIPDGQGGLLAAWTFRPQNFGSLSLQVEFRMENLTDSGQNEYTLPVPVSFPSDPFELPFFPPNSTLVLGENGTAFAVVGKVVSFDTATGTVHWTWQPESGSAVMVAASAGNSVVAAAFFNDGTHHIARLDSNGQATFDAWTWPGFPIQYGFGDMWLAQGSVEAISAPGLLWPDSSWPQPNEGGPRTAHHHFDFELFFCAANLCAPDQDVAFVYSQDNPAPPLGEPNPTTNLTMSQQTTIRAEAFKAFKAAFAGLPIRINVAANGAVPLGQNGIQITGDLAPMGPSGVACGSTLPPRLGIPTRVSLVFYLTNMEQAQFALGVQISGPTPDNQAIFDNLVRAIGRGIGNNSAHEMGHQLNLEGMDDDAIGTYNAGSCTGEKDPSIYTGIRQDGTSIRWEDIAARSLRNTVFAP